MQSELLMLNAAFDFINDKLSTRQYFFVLRTTIVKFINTLRLVLVNSAVENVAKTYFIFS